MVKFTIEEIRTLMDYKHNIRNMSGTLSPRPLNLVLFTSEQNSPGTRSESGLLLCSHCSCGPR